MGRGRHQRGQWLPVDGGSSNRFVSVVQEAQPVPGGRRIVLVSCVGSKLERPAPAKDLYCSQWFVKARRGAEACADRWWILSAQHGLVDPDAVIKPYDKTLNTMQKHQYLEWALKTYRALRPQLGSGDEVCFLAGTKYREHLARWLAQEGLETSAPMEGLAIGKQLQCCLVARWQARTLAKRASN